MSVAADRAKNLHADIAQILLQDWDPIGVRSFPEAADEYDAYVPYVYKLLISRRPVLEVHEYLEGLETQNMGLKSNFAHTNRVAQKLVDLCGYRDADAGIVPARQINALRGPPGKVSVGRRIWGWLWPR